MFDTVRVQPRANMLNIKFNMKSGQTVLDCVLCSAEGNKVEETQKHIFYCPVINKICANLIYINADFL